MLNVNIVSIVSVVDKKKKDIHDRGINARGLFTRLRMTWSSKPKSGYINSG